MKTLTKLAAMTLGLLPYTVTRADDTPAPQWKTVLTIPLSIPAAPTGLSRSPAFPVRPGAAASQLRVTLGDAEGGHCGASLHAVFAAQAGQRYLPLRAGASNSFAAYETGRTAARVDWLFVDAVRFPVEGADGQCVLTVEAEELDPEVVDGLGGLAL